VVKDRTTLPTIRSRELGDGLRAAMRGAGMGVRELARRLDWTHPYLSHLLTGNRAVSELDLISIVVACKVERGERDRLLRLCRELGTRGWLQQYDAGSPEPSRTLVDHERKATGIAEIQLTVIPRLLQTEGYARVVIERASGRDVESLVRAWLTRQDVFNRSQQPRMKFFVHEFALRAMAGDAAVMSDQLHHLLRISVRPSLEVRIIQGTAGAQSGSFALMEFADFDPVVYLEGEVSAVFLEQPHQIAVYERILTALEGNALGRTESQELIAAVATELYAGHEDQQSR
jgi:transcriptional regulator with XRE-family HTH domain